MPEDLGLSLLSSSAAFGAFSAWSSSLFTVRTFVDDEKKTKDARLAANLGALSGIGIGVGTRLTFGKKANFAMWAAFATAAVLWSAFDLSLRDSHIRRFLGSNGMLDMPGLHPESLLE